MVQSFEEGQALPVSAEPVISIQRPWLTLDEGARYTGHVNARAFKRWAQMNRVRIYYIGRMARVTIADIDKAVRRSA
jgi:hypothetical protein